MANRNRMGTQGAFGYGATNAANNGRNSAYEFSTELGGNTAGTVAGATTAGRAGQAGRVGANRTQTTANLRGKYGR